VHGELDELKDIMVRNIGKLVNLCHYFNLNNKLLLFSDSVALRGEKLELLVNKTENLCSQSMNFRVQSRTLQRSLFWKNVKIYVLFIAIGLVSKIFYKYCKIIFLYFKLVWFKNNTKYLLNKTKDLKIMYFKQGLIKKTLNMFAILYMICTFGNIHYPIYIF